MQQGTLFSTNDETALLASYREKLRALEVDIRRLRTRLAHSESELARLRSKRGFQPKTLRDPAWRVTKERHKTVHPECEFCGSTEQIEVHHVIPVKDERSLELDSRNLLTVCHACHRSATFCHPGGDTRLLNFFAPQQAFEQKMRLLLGDQRVDELIAQSIRDLTAHGLNKPLPFELAPYSDGYVRLYDTEGSISEELHDSSAIGG